RVRRLAILEAVKQRNQCFAAGPVKRGAQLARVWARMWQCRQECRCTRLAQQRDQLAAVVLVAPLEDAEEVTQKIVEAIDLIIITVSGQLGDTLALGLFDHAEQEAPTAEVPDVVQRLPTLGAQVTQQLP